MNDSNDSSLDLAETYVAKITAAYHEEQAGQVALRTWRERQVGNIVEVGRLLLDAKAAVGHGKFMEHVLEKVPFGLSKAERRMTIAKNTEVSKSANWTILPAHPSTLVALANIDAQVGPGTLARLIADNTIHPDITVRDIYDIVETLTPAPSPGEQAAAPSPVLVPKAPPKKPKAQIEAEATIKRLKGEVAWRTDQLRDVALDAYVVRSQVACLLCGKEYWLDDDPHPEDFLAHRPPILGIVDLQAQQEVAVWVKSHIDECHPDDNIALRYTIERALLPPVYTSLTDDDKAERRQVCRLGDEAVRQGYPPLGFAADCAPKMLPPAPPEIAEK